MNARPLGCRTGSINDHIWLKEMVFSNELHVTQCMVRSMSRWYRVLRPIVLQGLQGVGRSYGLLNEQCYWPGMNRYVREHVRRCFQCTLSKAHTPVVRPSIRHLLAFKPMECLAIDFLKLDRGHGGFEDILMMTN